MNSLILGGFFYFHSKFLQAFSKYAILVEKGGFA
jgi:hypothetical protein